jgi:hypothetical protein
MWYSNLEKTFYFSTYPPPAMIHLSHRFTSASKPASWKSFVCCLSHFRTTVSTSSSSAKRFPPRLNPLYTTNASHRKQETFLYEHPFHWVLLSTKNRTTEPCSSVIHSSSTDYWNQPVNMRVFVCYLDCHEAGLCCYLVIYIENPLRPLQLFYFHLWPVYWLSLIWFICQPVRYCID